MLDDFILFVVHCLSQVIQGTEMSEGGGWEETQNWLIAL